MLYREGHMTPPVIFLNTTTDCTQMFSKKRPVAFMQQVKLFDAKLRNLKSTCSICLKFSRLLRVGMKKIHEYLYSTMLCTKKLLCVSQQLLHLASFEKLL